MPLAPGRTVGLEAVDWAGYRVQHQDLQAVLREVGTGSAAAAKAGCFLTAPAGGGAAVGHEGTSTR